MNFPKMTFNMPKINFIDNIRMKKSNRKKAENSLIVERTNAIKNLREASSKALTAMMEMASTPTMSLNSELYGSKPYSSDIWSNNTAYARRQCRIAESQSPAAQAMILQFGSMVIGPRLELQAAPVWGLIPGAPIDLEKQQKIVKNIEQRFRLWAKNKKSDYEENNNHYKRSRRNFHSLLLDGEYFEIYRYTQTRKRNPLTVQFIKPENIQRSTSIVSSGNTESEGIEYNSKGIAVAYHVYNPTTSKSTRVLKTGPKSGRTFVIHNKLGNGRRGVGILAGIITELTKLADFQALEIQAAVINALFAVVVETEIGGDPKPLVNKQGISGSTYTDTVDYPSASEFEAKLNSTDFAHGGSIVQGMGEGQKLKSFDTKRPTANFEQFFKATLRNLLSAKGMPYDVAMYDPEASYSAIRSNLLIFWNRVMTLRFDHSTDYEDVEYRMWMYGEVDNGNIIAPGWSDETIQDAWCNAKWTGPQRPDIDPKKSADAAEIEVKNGWKTDSMTTAERGGGDWEENMQRKGTENKLKAKANEPLVVQDKTTYANSKSETKTESKTV